MKLKRDQRGFTLIELVIVLGIIAALAATMYTRFQRFSGRGRSVEVIQTIDQLRKAVEVYYADVGFYPPNNTISALWNRSNVRPTGVQALWQGPYVTPPTGTATSYRTPYGGTINIYYGSDVNGYTGAGTYDVALLITKVPPDVATELNMKYDNEQTDASSGSKGIVVLSPQTDGTYNVYFVIAETSVASP